MRKKLILISFCVLFVVGMASADDFYSPFWSRTGPTAMTAEWDFLASTNPVDPDGPLTNIDVPFKGGYDTRATIDGGSWDDDGTWYFQHGGSISIEMDNVVDILPVKDLLLQITYSGQTAPSVDWSQCIGFDSEVGTNVDFEPIDVGDPDASSHWEYCRLYPNPDWELIWIDVPDNVTIDQIIIDTQSIPEPATVALLGLGTLFLIRIRRRRK